MSKVRIYDLAREKTPTELDEKAQKKVQAEITRQVIAYSPKFGQSPKTASSSIDVAAADQIMAQLDVQAIIEDVSQGGGKSRPKVLRKVEAEVTVEEPQKKKLKIVRRISQEQLQQEQEAEKEEEKPEEEEKQDAEALVEEEIEEDQNEETQESIKEMMSSFNKPRPSPQAGGVRQIANVKSIPLKPSSSFGGGAQRSTDGQPYRVAKPTFSAGMGRKKKRSGVDDRPTKKVRTKKEEVVDDSPKIFIVTKPMTVRELSHKVSVPETSIITYFFMKRIIKTVNDMLEKDLIVEYLDSIGYLVETGEEDAQEHEELKKTLEQDETAGNLIARPPVVTIMGHVDHGKTTLLDTIRQAKSKVVDQESGGITQHISTYRIETVDYDGNTRKVTFIDTPGHEAFSAMRRRGANVTDIVILLVAANDGVMPQTIESIKYIREAKVPFLVAVNKIDAEGANPDKVFGQLTEHGIVVEQYGGDVVCSMISALKGENLDDLLEKILLVADAELSEVIRSNPDRLALGTVIEAELSRAKGPLATVLIQNGTLKTGDYIAAGAVSGRVKAMFDEYDQPLEEAGPSTPVKLLGFAGVPKAGDAMSAYKSVKEAKEAAEELAREELEAKRFAGLSSFVSEVREGQQKEMHIMIKADVQGSAEAIAHELNKLSTDEVLVKPISVESGSITSNDVYQAERTNSVIVGFHVGTDSTTAKLAEKLGVTIKSYEVIYKVTEDVERAVLGMHEPDIEEVKLGELEVRQIFNIDKRTIAGCFVTSGKVERNKIARVLREGAKIYEGNVDYLRRFKDDAKEVKEGFECGLSFEKYNDLQEGDVVECWMIKEVARTKL